MSITPPTTQSERVYPFLMDVPSVLAAVATHAPHLSQHMEVERAWVWYAGPSLQHSPEDRAALKLIGFKFKSRGNSGHVLPSGKIGFWAHHGMKPLPTKKGKRRGKRPNDTPDSSEQDDERSGGVEFDDAFTQQLAALGI